MKCHSWRNSGLCCANLLHTNLY